MTHGDAHTGGGSGSAGDTDDEARFLAAYDPTRYEQTAVTVDVVAFVVQAGVPAVLLVERGGHPYRGSWALPGGFLDPGDPTLDHGARRELREETGVDVAAGDWNAHFAQLATYGDVGRDPRQRTVSVAYVGVLPEAIATTAGSDAAQARFWPVTDLALGDAAGRDTGLVTLAFDHARIVSDALVRARPELGAPSPG